MLRQSLTALAIRKLSSDAGERVELWHGALPGFGVRVSSAGTKAFVVLYRLRGQSRRMTLGRYPVLSLADARAMAKEVLSKVAHGIDPQLSSSLPSSTSSSGPIASRTTAPVHDSKVCGISNWTLHDLRRSVATHLGRLNVAPHVVERILNHSSGTFAGVAGVYNRFEYLPEMREALELWAGFIRPLATAHNSNE